MHVKYLLVTFVDNAVNQSSGICLIITKENMMFRLIRWEVLARSLFLSAGLLVSATSVQAGIINVSFDDRGSSTVDLTTNIEWLDLTETLNLSRVQVESDLSADGGLFDVLDGWRYATRSDFRILVSNWFAVSFSGGTLAPPVSDDLYVSFIRAFGDTGDAFFDASLSIIDINPLGAGVSSGVLADRSGLASYSGNVRDNNYVFRSDGRLLSNNSNLIFDTLTIDNESSSAGFGHYLIRDFSASNTGGGVTQVSEPASWWMLTVLPLWLLIQRRRSKRY